MLPESRAHSDGKLCAEQVSFSAKLLSFWLDVRPPTHPKSNMPGKQSSSLQPCWTQNSGLGLAALSEINRRPIKERQTLLSCLESFDSPIVERQGLPSCLRIPIVLSQSSAKLIRTHRQFYHRARGTMRCVSKRHERMLQHCLSGYLSCRMSRCTKPFGLTLSSHYDRDEGSWQHSAPLVD